jgi:hypothetical protein
VKAPPPPAGTGAASGRVAAAGAIMTATANGRRMLAGWVRMGREDWRSSGVGVGGRRKSRAEREKCVQPSQPAELVPQRAGLAG